MRAFFEGMPEGLAIPWSAWALGMFWWFLLLGTFTFLCVCLVVIFRVHWTEHERLTFPLMDLPQAMIRESDGPGLWPGIF